MKHRLLVTVAFLALATLPAQAQLFGPSDEEVARQKAHEDGQDAGIQRNAQDLQRANTELRQLLDQAQAQQAQLRDLSERVRSLTDSLARATGANEELTHQVTLLNGRIEQQQRDFNVRLCTMSAQQLGVDAGSLNCAAAAAGNAPLRPAPQAQIAPGASLAPLGANSNFGDDNRGRAPGILGTLPAPGAPVPRPAAVGGGDSRQFDSAMNLLTRQQYVEAAAGFRAYADSHPDDDALSPQALYWVGHIAFMQQDYAAASRTLAEAAKKYPKSARAPDIMLKLGQSLVAQGQGSNGCTVFRGITKRQYPDVSQSTLDAVAAARRSSNCR